MRTTNFAAVAAAAAIGTLLVAGCGPASLQASLPAANKSAPTTVATGPATGTPQVVATAGRQLPVSVESDSQMTAAGNNGPSSAILSPGSCELTGTTVTAKGSYTNGGFVPNVYDRYGDIIVLYVLGAPSAGLPEGAQLAVSTVSESPVLASPGPWHVSVSVSSPAGVPARCVVAAQPTHDPQLAPGSTPAPTPTTTAAPGGQLPVSVESGSQMTAAGNDGPSSAILSPASCELTGTTVTAEGSYTNGGFVPNVYDRYGDVIVLYVLGAPSAGLPAGAQLAVSTVSESPVLASPGPWHVSVSVSSPAGVPARCVVAAQPTHDIQLAP